MGLPSTGPITMGEVGTEFEDAAPHSLSEFYDVAEGVPASGEISLSDLRGKSNVVEHAIRYIGGAANSSITITVPSGVSLSSNDPVVFVQMITWDGVGNSVNSPSIGGTPDWTYNSGGAYRGYTLLAAKSVPEGTTVTCSFTPGGGWDQRYIYVWAVYDVPQVIPDIVFKTESSSSAAREYTVPDTHDPSSCFAIAENWQGGTNAFTSPIAQLFYVSNQGQIRGGYNPTPRNGGTAPNTGPIFFENNFGNGCCGEEAFSCYAWLRAN